MQYLIVKKRNKYALIDTLPIELDVNSRGESTHVKITGDNKVYLIHSYEVVDDWYADTGYITHYEKHKEYVGKLIYASNDIEKAALMFADYINLNTPQYI